MLQDLRYGLRLIARRLTRGADAMTTNLEQPRPSTRKGFDQVWFAFDANERVVEFIAVAGRVVYEIHGGEHQEEGDLYSGSEETLEAAHKAAQFWLDLHEAQDDILNGRWDGAEVRELAELLNAKHSDQPDRVLFIRSLAEAEKQLGTNHQALPAIGRLLRGEIHPPLVAVVVSGKERAPAPPLPSKEKADV